MRFQNHKGRSMYAIGLHAIRQYFRLTLREMSEPLEFGSAYISSVENGLQPPSIKLLEAYAQFLSVPLSTLIRFCEIMNAEPHQPGASVLFQKIEEWANMKPPQKG